jgi:hypothetical protein
MQVVIEAGDEVWQRRDPDVVMSLTQLVEGGMTRLAESDPGLCAARLPRVFHALVPQVCGVCVCGGGGGGRGGAQAPAGTVTHGDDDAGLWTFAGV